MAFQPPFSDPPINQRQNGPPPNARGACWPDLGVQMDLNALWEYVNSLSQLHEGIRAETQSVLHGVQTIQARGLDGSSTGTSPVDGARINGALNSTQPTIGALQSRISTLESQLSSVQNSNSSLTQLLSQYESALTATLEKLRPFTSSHTSALHAQKAHYLALLESERQMNLELRLEHQQWQRGLGNVMECVREALGANEGAEGKWRRRVEGLRVENRALRRLCGLEVDDSDSEKEMEGPLQEGEAGSSERGEGEGEIREERGIAMTQMGRGNLGQ